MPASDTEELVQDFWRAGGENVEIDDPADKPSRVFFHQRQNSGDLHMTWINIIIDKLKLVFFTSFLYLIPPDELSKSFSVTRSFSGLIVDMFLLYSPQNDIIASFRVSLAKLQKVLLHCCCKL